MEKRTALAPEELAGLYRRHIQMVYQICLLMPEKRPRRGGRRPDGLPQAPGAGARPPGPGAGEGLAHRRRPQRVPGPAEALVAHPPGGPGGAGPPHLAAAGGGRRVGAGGALPARERLILYLYYYQGYSTGEIAQLLGESPGTLRSHLSRARKALKLRLEAEGYGPS